jgi:hypothetical protein
MSQLARLSVNSSEVAILEAQVQILGFHCWEESKNVMARLKKDFAALCWAVFALLLTVSLSFQAASPASQAPTAKAAPPTGAKVFRCSLSTSPDKPAFAFSTTQAHLDKNTCPRRWVPVVRFSTTTTTAGKTFC